MFLQRDEIAMAFQQINAFDLTSRFTSWMSEINPKQACAVILRAAQTCPKGG